MYKTSSLLFYNPKYRILLKMVEYILLYQRGKPMTALFKDSKAFFSSQPYYRPPTIPSPPHSFSFYYSPCHNPLFMVLLLHLCGYIYVCDSPHAAATWLFCFIHSISHFPLSFNLFPPTLATYFIVMFCGLLDLCFLS